MDWIMPILLASCKDLTNASTSKAAFLRFSLDRSPKLLWTTGGKGDSIETMACCDCCKEVLLDRLEALGPMDATPCGCMSLVVCSVVSRARLPLAMALVRGRGGCGACCCGGVGARPVPALAPPPFEFWLAGAGAPAFSLCDFWLIVACRKQVWNSADESNEDDSRHLFGPQSCQQLRSGAITAQCAWLRVAWFDAEPNVINATERKNRNHLILTEKSIDREAIASLVSLHSKRL